MNIRSRAKLIVGAIVTALTISLGMMGMLKLVDFPVSLAIPAVMGVIGAAAYAAKVWKGDMSMKSRLVLLVTFTSFMVLLICSSLYADDPIEGENFIWVDLGDKDEGLLLSLAGNGGDGITEVDDQAGVECKKLPFPYNGPGHNHMYFDIDDSFIFGGDNEVWIVMEYFDLGEGINCQYDSNGAGPVDGAFRGAGDGAFLELKPGNTETWQIHTWIITDGRFENRANGHDFRFSTHARGDMWVNRLWIFTFEPPDPFNPEDIGKAQAVEPGGKATTVWGALKQSL